MPGRSLPQAALQAVLLALALAGASACELAFSSFKAEARDEWTKTFDLAAPGRVEVANHNGTITVERSADAKLHVRAERIAKAGSDQAAKDLLTRIEIKETVSADSVRLETRTPSRGMFSGHGEVNYVLQVPAAAGVTVDNVNGRVTLRDLGGRVRAETTNGGIEGRGLSGAVEASTTNGGIDLELDAVANDGVELDTTNGGIRLRLPETAGADLSAQVTNGGIDTGGLKVETVGEASRKRLEGRLNGGGPRIRLEVTNGGIRLSGKAAN